VSGSKVIDPKALRMIRKKYFNFTQLEILMQVPDRRGFSMTFAIAGKMRESGWNLQRGTWEILLSLHYLWPEKVKTSAVLFLRKK
jgi:hypothetical protein